MLKLNSGEDTAKFDRTAFEAPQKFHGKDINIAGKELSMTEIAETMSRVFDKKVVFETVSSEVALERGMLQGTLYAMEWLEDVPACGFDIQETREYGVALKSFAEWLEENRGRFEINQIAQSGFDLNNPGCDKDLSNKSQK
ncbi:hypothetical protein GRF59_02570 [Paenibacillus sp. HJL G12]|uniref:NmrA-like domain-containing protein n=1 Tax=Paenibacillus dendrobii TaxID=2691084 RepID=A0A7X3IEM2_9BACL|nr:hypothetical protein [Paenibacillus dendrobii]